MAIRTVNRLTDAKCKAAKKPGHLNDGGGLFLLIGKNRGRSWSFVSRKNGRWREMGLGSFPNVSLAKARQKADKIRITLAEGGDPFADRRKAETPTFGEFADGLLDDILSEFRNAKHRQQWRNTLHTYAAPIWKKKIDEIGTDDILSILKSIWTSKNETASRVRGRIERVLDAAKARGLRDGENPARWRGHLSNLLPKRQKLQRGHHAAMPYSEVPGFVQKLCEIDRVSARALEFTILAATRSGETRLATWSEVDLQNGIWTIPAARMKAGREHRIPITERMAEILAEMNSKRINGFVFPGSRRDSPLSDMTLAKVIRSAGIHDATVHGFRSSFRDWAAERAPYPREIAEQALAHVVGDATERAYRRGDALEKRREMMTAWGQYVAEPAETEETA